MPEHVQVLNPAAMRRARARARDVQGRRLLAPAGQLPGSAPLATNGSSPSQPFLAPQPSWAGPTVSAAVAAAAALAIPSPAAAPVAAPPFLDFPRLGNRSISANNSSTGALGGAYLVPSDVAAALVPPSVATIVPPPAVTVRSYILAILTCTSRQNSYPASCATMFWS